MALHLKYNKITLHELHQQLTARMRALPTLKNKESALRMEIKKLRDSAHAYDRQLLHRMDQVRHLSRMWVEFEQGLVRIKKATYRAKVIAGVKIPVLESLEFDLAEISQYHKPDWFLDGILILEELARLRLLHDVALRATDILEYARRKTTQKVNLYEKVQIPEYHEAIRKIKRFLEDEENIGKASQKILKKRNEQTAGL